MDHGEQLESTLLNNQEHHLAAEFHIYCPTLQVDTDFSNDSDIRTMLLVHDTKPPFLDGRVIFTKQSEPVLPLKDSTSDMAVIAKSGSKLVKEIREKKNEGKSRQRFWEVAGSKMGKITGGQNRQAVRDTLCFSAVLQSQCVVEVTYVQRIEKGVAKPMHLSAMIHCQA